MWAHEFGTFFKQIAYIDRGPQKNICQDPIHPGAALASSLLSVPQLTITLRPWGGSVPPWGQDKVCLGQDSLSTSWSLSSQAYCFISNASCISGCFLQNAEVRG